MGRKELDFPELTGMSTKDYLVMLQSGKRRTRAIIKQFNPYKEDEDIIKITE